MGKEIKIFLVDDSPLALEILRKILEPIKDFQIIYKAIDGYEALRLIPQLKPDIVCLDFFLPKLKGAELVTKILEAYPVPILVISGLIDDKNTKEIFDVLEAGALDFVPKPQSVDPKSDEVKKLIDKVRVLSNVLIVPRRLRYQETMKEKAEKAALEAPSIANGSADIITIGASTGGPAALEAIFKRIPGNFPIPILCVQHISKGFLDSFVEWLTLHCSLKFKIVKGIERPKPGFVYFPEEGKHLKITSRKEIYAEKGLPGELHCPSINEIMTSAAKVYGKKAVGILLTGMGSDGARGLLAIKEAGGMTIAQSEGTCTVFGMPKEAIQLGAASLVLGLDKITFTIQKLAKPMDPI